MVVQKKSDGVQIIEDSSGSVIKGGVTVVAPTPPPPPPSEPVNWENKTQTSNKPASKKQAK